METKRISIVACKPLPNYHIVGKGVFQAWNSIEFFNQVRIDPKTDTVAWDEDIDLDAYVLREKIEDKKSR